MSTRTQVVVIGAGPAGLTVANLLRRKGIDCVLLEQETREYIEQRPRAGFVEEWAVRALQRYGLADRLLRTAETQTVSPKGHCSKSGSWTCTTTSSSPCRTAACTWRGKRRT